MGFFGSFFGSDQRKDIMGASQQAKQAYNRGLRDFTDTTQDFLGQSLGFYQPFAQAGLGAQNLYSDYLGTNGPEARQGFFDDLQFGPEFEAANEYGIRALDRSASARGQTYSGGQLEDLYNFGMQNFGAFLNPYADRLERAAGQGANIAQQQAGMTSQAGQNIADAQFGTNQLLANNAINTGNAVAETRNIGINNIHGLGQLATNILYGGGSGGGFPGGGGSSAFVGQPQYDAALPWLGAA